MLLFIKMYKYIIVILLLLYLLYYFLNNSIENFDNNEKQEEYEEPFDKEFVDFYEIIYRDYSDVDFEWKIIKEKGFKNYDKENSNLICIDQSQNMINKAYELNPNIKFKKYDLVSSDKFENNEFTHIIFDTNTIHYNHEKKIAEMLKNCHKFLKDNGKLIIPVLDSENISRAARYYTTSYLDDHGIIHGYTYLNNFAHDCYYILDEEDKNFPIYFDKIILEDGRARVKKTGMYVPKKEYMFDLILKEGFKVDYISKRKTFFKKLY